MRAQGQRGTAEACAKTHCSLMPRHMTRKSQTMSTTTQISWMSASGCLPLPQHGCERRSIGRTAVSIEGRRQVAAEAVIQQLRVLWRQQLPVLGACHVGRPAVGSQHVGVKPSPRALSAPTYATLPSGCTGLLSAPFLRQQTPKNPWRAGRLD